MRDIFKSKKILIVDDNEKTIQLLGDFLKSNGDFNTTVAKNGKEAIERALSFKPNLILMDINMPVMDGVEACKKIKQLEDLSDIPIIFLTAQNSIEEKVKALEAKGSDFINIYNGLIKSGMKEENIFKILGSNWLKFMKKNFG